ncbi:hypothetical protein ACIQFU_38105 [Streptomyces sp. NPDC093065]|uniref:hypothetical protein n=1 Tax=Streptomyces sp. NPDC093065 TaxID=3366021 RepID=UPI0037F875B9
MGALAHTDSVPRRDRAGHFLPGGRPVAAVAPGRAPHAWRRRHLNLPGRHSPRLRRHRRMRRRLTLIGPVRLQDSGSSSLTRRPSVTPSAWPSTAPELQGRVSPAVTASRSRSMPAASERGCGG